MCDDQFMISFFNYIKKEHTSLIFNEKEYKISENLIKTMIKSLIAQDLWGSNEFYIILNTKNSSLNAALEVLNKNTYEKLGLTK